MDYTEIIEIIADKHYPLLESDEPLMRRVEREIERLAFKNGLKQAKQITEIEKLEGKIEVLEEERSEHYVGEEHWLRLQEKIESLEQLLDKLISELKLK